MFTLQVDAQHRFKDAHYTGSHPAMKANKGTMTRFGASNRPQSVTCSPVAKKGNSQRLLFKVHLKPCLAQRISGYKPIEQWPSSPKRGGVLAQGFAKTNEQDY